MTNSHDPRPALARAMDQVGAVIALARHDDALRPTPCADMDVATLIDHLQGVVRRVGVVAAGEPFQNAPSTYASTDWQADWAQGRAGTDAALAAADLTREVAVPWGSVTLAQALGTYIGELSVHSWDLATSTGRLDLLDPALAEVSIGMYHLVLPAEVRGGPIPFGPVVEVGPDAGPYERLVAWTGRDPVWTAPEQSFGAVA